MISIRHSLYSGFGTVDNQTPKRLSKTLLGGDNLPRAPLQPEGLQFVRIPQALAMAGEALKPRAFSFFSAQKGWVPLNEGIAQSEQSRGTPQPQADGVIPTAADDLFAIGAEGHREDSLGMAGQGLAHRLAGGHIPQPDGFILRSRGIATGTATAADDLFAIRAEGHRADIIGMAAQGLAPRLTGGHIFFLMVRRPPGSTLFPSTTVLRSRADISGMAAQGLAHRLAGGHIPQADGVIITAADDLFAIRAEGHRADRRGVL